MQGMPDQDSVQASASEMLPSYPAESYRRSESEKNSFPIFKIVHAKSLKTLAPECVSGHIPPLESPDRNLEKKPIQCSIMSDADLEEVRS
jgi:hypothetical protein